MKKNKKSQFLLHTKYVASAFGKTLHNTENPCDEAYLIPPDERWYLNSIPSKGNYRLCKLCFLDSEDENNEEELLDKEDEVLE